MKRIAIFAAGTLAFFAQGCGYSTPFVELETYDEDGTVWFTDSSGAWSADQCVTLVTVIEYDKEEDPEKLEGKVVWQAGNDGAEDRSSKASECIFGIPFSYGSVPANAGESELAEAQELVPGMYYEVFVKTSEGTGTGHFILENDGSVSDRI